MRFVSRYIIPISILLSGFSCAVKEAPSGGPEDKTPPTIVDVRPEPGSVNIPVDSRFEVTFSKPMDHAKTEGAVFLSPVFWDYPEMKWSGKKLTVIPPEELKKNSTYVLTIGAGAVGHHRNALGKSYSFAFSTGAVIDSGLISGSVFLAERGRTVFDVWAYAVYDTANPEFLTRIPDYATQVDSIGGFKISYMGANQYVVIAIDDKNDDLFWDPTSESIGLPPAVISLTEGRNVNGVVLKPERRDTTLAYISKVKVIDNRKLAVEFSQPVLEKMMLDTRYYQISLSESLNLDIEAAYLGHEKLILETAPLQEDASYRLRPVEQVSIWGVPFDTAGMAFRGVSVSDTVGPEFISAFPEEGSMTVYQDSTVELTFSERIKALRFSDAVTVVADSTDTLYFRPGWIAPNIVRLRFSSGIPRERRVEVTLDPAGIYDIAGNSMSDSSLSFSFRLPPEDTVGYVTANIVSAGTSPVIGEIKPLSKKGRSYKSQAENNGAILFNDVLPGSYRFELFMDTDNNGEWTPGVISPFKPAERFSFLADSLNVRSRWTTDIGQVELPEIGQ